MFTSNNCYSRKYVYQFTESWIYSSQLRWLRNVWKAGRRTRREYYFSFSRFTINREVPARPDDVGAFLVRRRLAHFKINRKHRGKCLALIRADFSLYSTANFPLASEFKGTLSPFIVTSDQEGIIRRGWLHFIPKWRSYPRTITRIVPLEKEINVPKDVWELLILPYFISYLAKT